MLPALALSACGSSSSDGKGSSADAKQFLGVWEQGCVRNNNGGEPYWSKTILEFKEGGKLENSGQEFEDELCETPLGDEGWEMTFDYKLGKSFEEGEGGASGWQLDVTFEEQKMYHLISKVYDDGDGEYFYMGVERDEDDEGLDLTSPENRPDAFDKDNPFNKK